MNKKISESELKALRAQMNPHFMFNAINSIQNFVLKNDSKSAQKYLTKFARLIRSVLENSKHELVWLNKEVEALELYVELEALRSSFSFDYEIVIDDSLNAENLFIPPMIIQPYIENAIIHGLRNLEGNDGVLKWYIFLENDSVKYVIEDNGIGRAEASRIAKNKKLSYGIQLSEDRLKLFNKGKENHVIITDLKDAAGKPCGTKVEVYVKINN